MRLIKSVFVAGLLGVSAITFTAATGFAAQPTAEKKTEKKTEKKAEKKTEKKCDAAGKECTTGDDCKAENCKPAEQTPPAK